MKKTILFVACFSVLSRNLFAAQSTAEKIEGAHERLGDFKEKLKKTVAEAASALNNFTPLFAQLSSLEALKQSNAKAMKKQTEELEDHLKYLNEQLAEYKETLEPLDEAIRTATSTPKAN